MANNFLLELDRANSKYEANISLIDHLRELENNMKNGVKFASVESVHVWVNAETAKREEEKKRKEEVKAEQEKNDNQKPDDGKNNDATVSVVIDQ